MKPAIAICWRPTLDRHDTRRHYVEDEHNLRALCGMMVAELTSRPIHDFGWREGAKWCASCRQKLAKLEEPMEMREDVAAEAGA